MAAYGIHEGLEELRKGNAWIVSEHTNIRGDETIVLEFEDGTRRSIPNVRPETLQMYLEAHAVGQKLTGGGRGVKARGGIGVNEALDLLSKGNAWIVSEHTNVRGDQTVVLELEDGTRRTIPNVKAETLKMYQEAHETGQKLTGGKGKVGRGGGVGINQALEELRKGKAWIVSEHTNVRGDETVIIECEDGSKRTIPNVRPETLQMYMEAHQTGQKLTGGKGAKMGAVGGGINEILDTLRKGNAWIISEHPTVQADQTVLVEFEDGTRKSISNVNPDVLKMLLEANQTGQILTGGKAAKGGGRGGPHGIAEALEALRMGNAKIVSEHTNIRGDETVLVEFRDGTRRSIPNVRKETLEEILHAQELGRRQGIASQ